MLNVMLIWRDLASCVSRLGHALQASLAGERCTGCSKAHYTITGGVGMNTALLSTTLAYLMGAVWTAVHGL